MSNPKLKSEDYANMGGINNKASPYNTGPMEFLDLVNYDFQQPGALSQRWGSTMYVGQTFGAPITSTFEFQKLNGFSQILIGVSGALWAGATTGQLAGISFVGYGSTFSFGQTVVSVTSGTTLFAYTVIGLRTGIIGLVNQLPSSVQKIATEKSTGTIYLDNANVFGYGGGGGAFAYSTGTDCILFIDPMPLSNNKKDFAVLDDRLFAVDGKQFVKYDGATTYRVSLPYVSRFLFLDPTTDPHGSCGASIFTVSPDAGTTYPQIVIPGTGTTGGIIFYLSYLNDRGFEGPLTPIEVVPTDTIGSSMIQSRGFGLSGLGGTYYGIGLNIYNPPTYGITSIRQYSYVYSGVSVGSQPLFSFIPTLLSETPTNGGSMVYIQLGTTMGGSFSAGALAPTQFLPINQTLGSTMGLGLGNAFTEYDITNYNPQYIETYQNRLFLAGFSSTPSTVWFSETAEPEAYFADSNFEVRTNDGDYVTCLKAYATRLYVFKKYTFHALYGDNPANFFLQEISLEYGCLNNNCAVVYDDILIFLDRKGVIKYNGASIEMLSTPKIQPEFDAMNFNAALTEAVMTHDKLRSQIIVSFPVNGATTNNRTLVFDYLVGGWTRYDGPPPSSLNTMQGRNSTKNLFIGSYSGVLLWQGPSFLSDNGAGITLYMKTRFLKPLGESMQEVYRRLYLNCDTYGTTIALAVNFYQDYGASIVYGTTVVTSQFQQRIDFGISAKSLSFEMTTIQTSQVFRLYGFTIESRLQRRV